jgi:hypothetical protein
MAWTRRKPNGHADGIHNDGAFRFSAGSVVLFLLGSAADGGADDIEVSVGE